MFFWAHMGIYAVDKVIHIFHTGSGSEYMIPDRKNIAIIAICMRLDIMMVDLMEMRCNEDPS